MKVLRIILIGVGSLVLLLLIVFGIYLLMNIQGVIEPSEINTPDFEHKVLIASQGSNFKNALVESLAVGFANKPVYVKIVDVTHLADVDENGWDAIVFIHTTEQNRLQPDVKKFLERIDDLDKVMLVTTSGSGSWKPDDYDVDVITSASKQKELCILTSSILAWLNAKIE